MKVGDLVRRTVPIPGIEKILGIVIKSWSHSSEACEVLWPDVKVTLPFKKNLEIVCEGG